MCHPKQARSSHNKGPLQLRPLSLPNQLTCLQALSHLRARLQTQNLLLGKRDSPREQSPAGHLCNYSLQCLCGAAWKGMGPGQPLAPLHSAQRQGIGLLTLQLHSLSEVHQGFQVHSQELLQRGTHCPWPKGVLSLTGLRLRHQAPRFQRLPLLLPVQHPLEARHRSSTTKVLCRTRLGEQHHSVAP